MDELSPVLPVRYQWDVLVFKRVRSMFMFYTCGLLIMKGNK